MTDKVIDFNQRKYKKEMQTLKENFNWVDPCAKCNEMKNCKRTCSEATRWWSVLAEIIKEGKKQNG
jgi:hypothetical protein